jgi:hypothetical protein
MNHLRERINSVAFAFFAIDEFVINTFLFQIVELFRRPSTPRRTENGPLTFLCDLDSDFFPVFKNIYALIAPRIINGNMFIPFYYILFLGFHIF